MRRAVFTDRDGTLMVDTGYPRDPAAVVLIDGAAAAVRELRARGFAVVLTSNQSGVGRGLVTRAELHAVHDRLVDLLRAEGATLDGAFYCEHAPTDGCECRKPLPGMLHDAARQLGIDLGSSVMIGDKPSDIAAGQAAGCATILLDPHGGLTAPPGSQRATSWADAVALATRRRELGASEVAPLVRRFPGTRLVVLGDLMLDEYIHGEVSRISPEAPVPVVEVRSSRSVLGGAANAAANITSLGGSAVLIGVVGDDEAAATLVARARERGVEPAVVTDPSRPTTRKTRIVARMQQVIRLDNESRAPLSEAVRRRLIEVLDAEVPRAGALLVSDYAKGVVSEEVCQYAITVARKAGIPVVVDPKTRDLGRYRGATVVTPNTHELELASGHHALEDADVVAAASGLFASIEGSALLVTRGARGMTLCRPEQPPLHLPARVRAVYDVTGAGDTVVGTLGVSLAVGASLEHAVELANLAAGIAVGKPGTSTVSPDELLDGIA